MNILNRNHPALFLMTLGLLLSSCGGAQSTPVIPVSQARSAAGPAGKLKHVIVIIQENRSFENFFAGYPNANAPMTGCASPSPNDRPIAAAAGRGSASGCPPGDTKVTLHEATFKDDPDLGHGWTQSVIDWNNGQMDGFTHWDTKHGKYEAYDYIDRSEIQPYWTMAQQYVLADEMFPTEFGGSFTGHLTLIAGTDDVELPNEAEVNFPSHAPDDCDSIPATVSDLVGPNRQVHYHKGPFPCFDQFNTIAQVLDHAGISWKIYATRVRNGGMWEPFEAIKYVRYGSDWPQHVIAPQTRVLGDSVHGKLASVDWVTPSNVDSDHPHWRGSTGPSWVASIVNAIGRSSYWSSSAIIVVWDDWGGFYDNAPPPQLDYRGLGIRVPCLIISPYAKQNYVSHVQYEYASILRFIEEVYGLPAGSIGRTKDGYTDGRAASLDDAFDFTQKPRAFKKIGSQYPLAHFLHEPPSNEPVDTE